ncbi:MAG TPA: hypothetical protein VFE60_23310 [Roseiarcus sp.]|jgi:hypothetical protein|nr:hypothetical protein [Roseiarcus sp.]
MPPGELQANRGNEELGRGGDSQNDALCGNSGGKLAAGDRDRREEHDRKNIGEQAVDESDIDLVRQLVGWRGMVAPSGVRHAKCQIW